ncbi:MAG TPA: hypothetical protein VGB14_18325 [Acidimicrobiales bacterium]|jgi:hypothetical protein
MGMAALALRARTLPLSTGAAVGLLVAGGAVGGALLGAALGLAGWAVGLDDHPAAVLAVAATAVLVLTVRDPGRRYGLNRQVGRRLGMAGDVRGYFFLSGVQLGAGVVTLVPYSAFLLLAAGLLVAGPAAAVAAGALYGAARLALAAEVLRGGDPGDPGRAMDVFSGRAGAARRLNLVMVALAAAAAWLAVAI